MRVSEEEKEKGVKSLSKEIKAKNFTNLERYMKIQLFEAYNAQNKINLMKITPTSVIKFSKIKDKERIFLSSKRKMTCDLQGNSHKTSTRFTPKTF